jgi:hypothetical protein
MATTKTILPKSKPDVIADLKGMETGRVTEAGKPVYKYKGEEISERAIDIEADGKVYVIPTVIKGKLYNPDAAARMFYDKKVEPINIIEKGKKTQEDITTMIKNRSVKLSKGGVAKQMELFEDGGLKDEGGMIDEVSGNDVPTGSTREEVRDDIPAQLSEGEFVFPADVVRYHGLDKLMQLRDEAKMGLRKMEDMGQMGNSEEATLPDDMPFSMEDLDMEDDEPVAEQEGDSIEMAEGGYVMIAGKPTPIPRIGGQLPPITTRPNEPTKNMAVGGFTNPTGTYQVPTNIATQPSYFQNYAQSTAPFSPFNQTQTPIGTPLSTSTPVVGQTGQGPSFNTLMPQLTGKRETLEYRNDAGQKLFIPFIDGKPIYPIPEGYSKYTAEEEVTPDKPTNVQSTSVRQDTGDGGDSNVLSGTSQVRGLDNSIVSTNFTNMSTADVSKNMGNMNQSQKGASVLGALEQAKGQTGFAKGLQQLGYGILGVTNPALGIANAYNAATKGVNPIDTFNQIGKPNPAQLNAITAAYGYDMKDYGITDDPSYFGDTTAVDARNEALSQAVFGTSLNDTKNMYGVTPTFQQKNEPGSFSPTGAFYDIYGSATSSKGDAEFASVKDFTNNFQAMMNSKTSFTGKSAIDTINDPNASDKAKENANRHLRELEKITGKMTPSVSDARDKAAVRDPSGGIGPSTGIGSQNIGIEDVDVTSLSDKQSLSPSVGKGVTTGKGFGTVNVESPGDNSNSNDNSSTDAGSVSEGGYGGVGATAKGGFINKKKMTFKKKQGGLASRK